jgi:hypothetical protein
MRELLKSLIQRCEVFDAPAVAHDNKIERAWYPPYNC